MTVQPDLTGILGEESISVEFSSGLVGIKEWKHFELITHPAGGPLKLLQLRDDNRVSFILANPFQIDPGYKVALSGTDATALKYSNGLQVSSDSVLKVYCVLSVEEEPFNVTANMLGPIVINQQAGQGRQIVLTDSSYNTRHPVAAAQSEIAGGE